MRISNGHVYAWKRDLPSQVPWFDHRLKLGVAPTPDVTANRKFVTWVYDQGKEGSCTANSAMGTNRFFRAVNNLKDFDGSRQFLYRATTQLAGYAGIDEGASISDTIEAEVRYGICHEELWPYATPLSKEPSGEAYTDALEHQVLVKAPVEQTQEALEAVLASQRPLHYGMAVYSSFESINTKATGIVTMPLAKERMLGGHALWLFDYDRPRRVFYGQNSWGPAWGQNQLGIYEIPYDYILDPDYASDYYTISSIEE